MFIPCGLCLILFIPCFGSLHQKRTSLGISRDETPLQDSSCYTVTSVSHSINDLGFFDFTETLGYDHIQSNRLDIFFKFFVELYGRIPRNTSSLLKLRLFQRNMCEAILQFLLGNGQLQSIPCSSLQENPL